MPSRYLVSVTVCCTLVGTLRAQLRPPPACDQFRAAVEADAKNLDAAARLGQCSIRDESMIAPGGDSSRLAFRSSWGVALRALRHAVEVDPSYAPAYRPLFFILLAETRDGCSYTNGVCSHVASIVRDGDGVITTPRLVISDRAHQDPYGDYVRESQTKGRANIVEARALAERWAAVAPSDWRPHEYVGQALLRLGDPVAGVDELEHSASLGDEAARRSLFWDRLEALVKTDRGADARRVLDEELSDPRRDTNRLRSFTVVELNALVGRSRPPVMSPADSARMQQARARADSIQREQPPTFLPLRTTFQSLLAAGDTAGARRELARTDSVLPPRRPVASSAFAGLALSSADQHLTMRDTAGAVARLAEIEQIFNERPFQYKAVTMSGAFPSLGRAWMLSGDLAAAQHRFVDAARMYRRVIGLWGGGDPVVQPVVDEARRKLAALPAR